MKIIRHNIIINKIKFRNSSYALVSSIVSSRLIAGSSTDEDYKTITFKAASVKTLKVYLRDYYILSGRKALLVADSAKMIRTLVKQLTYLIDKTISTVIGYNPNDIIVINEETFVFLDSELVVNFDLDISKAMISCPFSPNDFFFSPEMLMIKKLPAFIHYKTSYFSFACLIVYSLLGNDEFYKEYLNHKQPIKILNELDNHPIKQTRLYWFLSRCLVEDPNNRSIIFI